MSRTRTAYTRRKPVISTSVYGLDIIDQLHRRISKRKYQTPPPFLLWLSKRLAIERILSRKYPRLCKINKKLSKMVVFDSIRRMRSNAHTHTCMHVINAISSKLFIFVLQKSHSRHRSKISNCIHQQVSLDSRQRQNDSLQCIVSCCIIWRTGTRFKYRK